MENERHQTNNNNIEKNNRFHFTKSKKLLTGTTNIIYSKEGNYSERTKCETIPSLNKHLLSLLQNKTGEYNKITHMSDSIITTAKMKRH